MFLPLFAPALSWRPIFSEMEGDCLARELSSFAWTPPQCLHFWARHPRHHILHFCCSMDGGKHSSLLLWVQLDSLGGGIYREGKVPPFRTVHWTRSSVARMGVRRSPPVNRPLTHPLYHIQGFKSQIQKREEFVLAGVG